MSSVKEEVIKLIRKMPEDCTYEDIQYELYLRAKIEAGIKDVEEGKVISHEDLKKEISRWQK